LPEFQVFSFAFCGLEKAIENACPNWRSDNSIQNKIPPDASASFFLGGMPNALIMEN